MAVELNLAGKNAIVCGSTQGIGKAVAIALAQMGASITLCARNAEKLLQVQAELPAKNGQRHFYIQADFTRPEELQQALQKHLQQHPQVHILVNNTGGPAPGTAIDAATDAFELAFKAHLVCNQLLVQACVPSMKAAGFGRVINIISTSVKSPIPGLGVSNTIRGAVANWAKTLSTELGPFGVTVNNVLPGFTKTARLDALIAKRAGEAGKPVPEYETYMQQQIPARRYASPEEIAAAVAYLSSPSAGFVNGINLPVDGGNTPSL